MQSLFKNKSPPLWIPAAASVALPLSEDSSYVQAPAQTIEKTKAPDSATQTSQNPMFFLSPRKMQSLLHPVHRRLHPVEHVMLCFMSLQFFLVCPRVSGEPDLHMTLVNISLAHTVFISVALIKLLRIWAKSGVSPTNTVESSRWCGCPLHSIVCHLGKFSITEHLA